MSQHRTTLLLQQCLPVKGNGEGRIATRAVRHGIEFVPIPSRSKEAADGVSSQVEKIMHGAYFQVITVGYQRNRGDADEGIAGKVQFFAITAPRWCDAPSASNLPFALTETDAFGRGMERHDIYLLRGT